MTFGLFVFLLLLFVAVICATPILIFLFIVKKIYDFLEKRGNQRANIRV